MGSTNKNRFRLELEQLEDRLTPSGAVVTAPPSEHPPVNFVQPAACSVSHATDGLHTAAISSGVVFCAQP